MAHGQGGAEIGYDRGPKLTCNHEAPIVANSLRGEGFDASEDGTGRGTPLVPVAFGTTQITSAANYSRPKAGDPCHPLAAGAHAPAVAFMADDYKDGGYEECDTARPLTTSADRTRAAPIAVAFESRFVRNGRGAPSDVVPPLKAQSGETGKGDAAPLLATALQVRRLTPIECERLQGFPDGYTAIPWRGKPAAQCPDGPRYKALGNSFAVPVVRWIGSQIERASAWRA